MHKKTIMFYGSRWLVLFAIQFGMAYYFIADRYENQKEIYEHHLILSSSMEFELLKKAYDTLADATFELSINTPSLKKKMAEATGGDAAKQAEIRSQMYREFFHLYQGLGKYNLSQLQFHLPGSVSFLRFQHPEKYGDSLREVRPSIDAVNRYGMAVKGFEIGRFVHGFRHVYPLFYEKELVGSVELSYSFEALKEMAEKLYPAQYDMILKKSVINSKVFEEERSNYVASSLNEEYVKEIRYGGSNELFDPFLIQQLDKKVSQKIGNTLGAAKPYIFSVVWEEKNYVVVLIPLLNYDRQLSGYVVRYEHSTQLEAFDTDRRVIVMLAGMVAALIGFFIIGVMHKTRS